MAHDDNAIDGTLAEWVPILRELLEDAGAFSAILLVASENPAEGGREHPITTVTVDDEGAEVNLCADARSPAALTMSALVSQLEALLPEYSAYHLYGSAPWRALSQGVEVRADAPIINVVVDGMGKRVGFVGEGVRLDR